MRIAVLDDDEVQLQSMVQDIHAGLDHLVLQGETLTCVPFSQGEELKRKLRYESFDLLVLDWNVPDLDGFDLLAWLRKFQGDNTPVIMLTSRSNEADVVLALNSGADDYMVKPLRKAELCARIERYLIRYNRGLMGGTLSTPVRTKNALETLGLWQFDRVAQMVWPPAADGSGLLQLAVPSVENGIELTYREFLLALTLFRHAGEPLSRGHLLEVLGHSANELATRTLDSHIYRLRNKMGLKESKGVRLQTVYGRGYRLELLKSRDALGAPLP